MDYKALWKKALNPCGQDEKGKFNEGNSCASKRGRTSHAEGDVERTFLPGDDSGQHVVVGVHYSTGDRSETGIQRKYAGTGAAGSEKKFLVKDKTGMTSPESGSVFFYLPKAKVEVSVYSRSRYVHEIRVPAKMLVMLSADDDRIWAKAREKFPLYSAGNLWQEYKKIARREGWQGAIDPERGVGEFWIDVKPSQILTSASTAEAKKPKFEHEKSLPSHYDRLWLLATELA